MSRTQVKRRSWSLEEVQFLQENVGTDEVGEVIPHFRRNWPDRQPEVILTKIKRLKLSRKPVDGGWNCTGLADLLGVDRGRVHDWVERGLLASKRRSSKRHHRILDRDFVEFSKQYPEWLKDISPDRLALLLPKEVIETIASQPERTRGIKFRIRNSRTGQIYQSMREAERHEFLSRAAIAAVLKGNRTTRDGVGYQLVKRG